MKTKINRIEITPSTDPQKYWLYVWTDGRNVATHAYCDSLADVLGVVANLHTLADWQPRLNGTEPTPTKNSKKL